MKKQEIINLYSDFLENKTNNLFVNEVTPYDLHKLYNGALLYKSSWTDLFYSQIETELSNGMISRVPPTLSPDKMWPYSYVGGFSTEELYIPDSIIQHTKVNIEINLPNEMLLAPSVLEWDRDASFQYYGLYHEGNLRYRGRYINPNGTMLFWNPLWNYDTWRYEVPWGDSNVYPYFLSKVSLPCYFRLEDNGDISMFDFHVIPGTGGFGQYFCPQDDNAGQSVWTIGQSGMLYDWLVYDGHSITTGDWQKHPRFIRMARSLTNPVPLEDDFYVPISAYTGCPVGSPLIDSPVLAEYIDSETPEWTYSPLTWDTEEFDDMKDIWFHTKTHTQVCPHETSYSFRKVGRDKWQIVGHVRISIMSLATHEVGTFLDGDNAPILYTAGQPESIKPQIRVTACISVPDNITTGYIRTKS